MPFYDKTRGHAKAPFYLNIKRKSRYTKIMVYFNFDNLIVAQLLFTPLLVKTDKIF